jgi:hypothetical protein
MNQKEYERELGEISSRLENVEETLSDLSEEWRTWRQNGYGDLRKQVQYNSFVIHIICWITGAIITSLVPVLLKLFILQEVN